MQPDWLDTLLRVAAIGLPIGSVAYTAWATRRGEVDKKLIDLDRRVQRLEDGLKVLPTKDEMHSISLQLAGLSGQMGVLSERVGGQNEIMTRLDRVTRRHEEHLLKAGNPEKIRG